MLFSTLKQLHSEIGLDGDVCIKQAQAASSTSFEPVLSVHCLAALDLRADVEQPIDYLIIQKAVQSLGRSMEWTLEENMVNSLIFFAPLTSRRSTHTPFVQTGA